MWFRAPNTATRHLLHYMLPLCGMRTATNFRRYAACIPLLFFPKQNRKAKAQTHMAKTDPQSKSTYTQSPLSKNADTYGPKQTHKTKAQARMARNGPKHTHISPNPSSHTQASEPINEFRTQRTRDLRVSPPNLSQGDSTRASRAYPSLLKVVSWSVMTRSQSAR